MRLFVLGLLLVGLLARPAGADDDYLRYLPSDTKVVLTIHPLAVGDDERKQGHETLRQAFLTHLAPSLKKDAKLPISDVSRLVFALPYAGTLNGTILLEGKIDQKLFEHQMQLARRGGGMVVEKLGKPPANVHRRLLDEKKILLMAPPLTRVPPLFRKLVAPQEASVAVLDEKTLFASLSGRLAVERALRARPGRTGLRIPEELAKLLRKQDLTDVAVVTVMSDCLHPGLQLIANEQTREGFDEFEYIVARTRAGKEVSITIEVQGKSRDLGPSLEARSKNVLAVLRQILPGVIDSAPHRRVLDDLFKGFTITRKDARVTLTGRMSLDDARILLGPAQRRKK